MVCVCVYLRKRDRERTCPFMCIDYVSFGTSNIIQVLHFFFSKFYSIFLIFNLHVKGQEVCNNFIDLLH